MGHKEKLLELYDEFPFHKHPFWTGVVNHEFSLNQILSGEVQHFLRTKAGQKVREIAALGNTPTLPQVTEAAFQTYFEEVAPKDPKHSHLALIERLLLDGGITPEQLSTAKPTPGNVAAIALYKVIAERGPECHLIGAGVVEYFYSQLTPQIYSSYTDHYGMSPDQAETYRIHGEMDHQHATRAFGVIEECVKLRGYDVIHDCVRHSLVATSLHYDGMLQAAMNKNLYWNGA